MARTFSKNTANSLAYPTTNYLNGRLNGKGQVSIFARIKAASFDTGGGTNNRILNGVINDGGVTAVTGVVLSVIGDTGTSGRIRGGGRSVATDGLLQVAGVTNFSTGTWVRVGAVLDFATDTIRVYLNGVQDASGTASWANATYTAGTATSADLIGGPTLPVSATALQFDGDIADVAVWAGDIGTVGYEELEDYVPAAVRPDLLVSYAPLLEGQTPFDIWDGNSLTIAGSIPEARHPRVQLPATGATFGRRMGGFIVLPDIELLGFSTLSASPLSMGRVWLFARAGLARSGATRSGFFFQNIIITIAGVNHTDKLWLGTLEWEEIINEQADLASMRVFGNFTPAELNEITIALGSASNPIFGGTISKAKRRQNRNTGADYKSFDLSCSDWTYRLSKARVYGKFTGQFAHQVFLELAAAYAPGFTTGGVVGPSPSIAEIEFSGETLPEAFTRVARRVGWQWYPTPGKDLRFFAEETTQNPQALTVTNFNYWDFDFERNVDQLRTVVRVQGGGSETEVAINPASTTIPLPDLSWYSEGGGLVQVGGQLLTYAGKNATAITGIPPSGPGSITHRIPIGASINLHVVVEDAGQIAIVAAATGTDGRFEFVVTDRRLGYDGCLSRGQAELVYAPPLVTGHYKTFDRYASAGKRLTINLPAKGLVGNFTIVHVNAKLVAPGRVQRHAQFSSMPVHDFFAVLRRGGGEISDAA
jgi:hypothetical protein